MKNIYLSLLSILVSKINLNKKVHDQIDYINKKK